VDEEAAPEEFQVAIPSAVVASDGAAGSSLGLASLDDEPDLVEVGDDPTLAFRRTLGMFATGVTVITTRNGAQAYGMTANAFMSVSLRPPLVLVSVDRRARLSSLLRVGTPFGVSVLEESQAVLSDYFARRAAETAQEPQFTLVRDTPLVEGALAHVVAHVVRSYWGGDHTLFLGQVEYARRGAGEPLLFHGGRYERLVRDPRVFAALSQDLLGPILALGTERAYEDGDLLMRRGDPGAELMLVLEGTVRVDRPGRSLTLGPGDLVGEIEVLDPVGSRIADIVALGPVRCAVVTREALMAALEADPRAAVGLIEVLAARFRETA
jgi:flavin reductase (DIM6/NTAB) family NADH-FMN oxidoreductase RutF